MNRKIFTTASSFLLITFIACSQVSVPEISPLELREKIKENNDDIVMIDVRTQDEIDRGVISPDVITYDFYEDDFRDNIAGLDKDKTYYVYCHVGGRSGKAVKIMQELGFKNAFNVQGGILKWQEDGMKLVKKE